LFPQASHAGELDLRCFGAVGCAGTLALAAVLAGVFRVAAALSLAIVLAFTGVLGKCRRVLRDEHETGMGGGSTALSGGLSIQ